MKSDIRTAVNDALLLQATNKLHTLLEQALHIYRKNTPVITGETRKAWHVLIDGTRYDTVPNKPALRQAIKSKKSISITNDKEWITIVDQRHSLTVISNMEIKDRLRHLK